MKCAVRPLALNPLRHQKAHAGIVFPALRKMLFVCGAWEMPSRLTNRLPAYMEAHWRLSGLFLVRCLFSCILKNTRGHFSNCNRCPGLKMLQGGKLFRKWVSFTGYTGSAHAFTGCWGFVLLPTHNVPSRKVPSHKQLKIAKWSHRSVAKNTEESLLTNTAWCVIHAAKTSGNPRFFQFWNYFSFQVLLLPIFDQHQADTEPTGEDLICKCQWMRQEYRVSPMGHGLCHTCPSPRAVLSFWSLNQPSGLSWSVSGVTPGAAGLQGQGEPSWEQHLGGNCWWRGPRTAWPCCWLHLQGSSVLQVCSASSSSFPCSTSTWTGVIAKAKCISVSYSQDFRSW